MSVLCRTKQRWAQLACTDGTLLQARSFHLQQVLPSAAGYIQHALHPEDVRPIRLPVPQQRLCPLPHPAAMQGERLQITSHVVTYPEQNCSSSAAVSLPLAGGRWRTSGGQGVLIAAG